LTSKNKTIDNIYYIKLHFRGFGKIHTVVQYGELSVIN